MIIFVDIDETICETCGDPSTARDYSKATPIKENIKAINTYYEEEHTIVYWTARGSGSGIDWSFTTKNQLELWGAKYHELRFKKPIYDLFICDKALNTQKWEKMDRCLPKL